MKTIPRPADNAEGAAWLGESLLARFLSYVRVNTQSDKHSSSRPTTQGQRILAEALVDELRGLGVEDAGVDENGFVIGRVEPLDAFRSAPSVGFMAHMDTTQDVSGAGVEPQVHANYGGGPIRIAEGLVLDPEKYPELRRYRGETIITASGGTLLGADDKAGIAEIMTAAEYLMGHPRIPRGPVELIFTPDEETGFGMELFPLDRLKSSVCYTLDGAEQGSVETECFEAYAVDMVFRGRSIHTGSGRGKLINAIELASRFVQMLPKEESPQTSDGRGGFYCPMEIQGSVESATASVYIRDFEAEECLRRVEVIKATASALEALYPGSAVTLKTRRQYGNMRATLEQHPEVVQRLEQAIRQTGIEPRSKAIRGGTDGARLCEMGVPTPNIFTGGHNYHSQLEWAALPAMIKASQTVVKLAALWAEAR
jgi:tripeptide aminopeptidase